MSFTTGSREGIRTRMTERGTGAAQDSCRGMQRLPPRTRGAEHSPVDTPELPESVQGFRAFAPDARIEAIDGAAMEGWRGSWDCAYSTQRRHREQLKAFFSQAA